MIELFNYFLSKKKYWLLPIVFILVVLSFIIVFAASSGLAPYIYTLF